MINNSSTSDGLCDLDDLSGLKNESELPHLSDAISYETDIAPYRYIQIYAGVGSGKNVFINRFVNGDPERKIPKMIVLVITSRRSKVDELHADEEADYACCVGKWGNMTSEVYDEGDWERFQAHLRTIKSEWGEQSFYQKSVACTNAFIESYLRNVYDPADPGTHLWNLFDMIVVDEFHSLVMDASYQSAPFYVNSLIWEIAYRFHMADQKAAGLIEDPDDTITAPLCRHLVLMTGTPDTVRKYPVPYITPHVLDMMDTCVNVVPKNVWFLDMKQARELMEQLVTKKRRCIYFTNHVFFPEAFCKGTTMNPDTVAISFSAKDRRDALAAAAILPEDQRSEDEKTYARIYTDMVEAEESIANSSLIPSRFLLWLTTSRNKEGINIKSQDINDVFVESHNISDIIQMAGRVRHGVENLYIIVDPPGHKKELFPEDHVRAKAYLAPDARNIDDQTDLAKWTDNAFLRDLCHKERIWDFYGNRTPSELPYRTDGHAIRRYIEHIHNTEKYVRYDYFRNYFCYYYLSAVARRYLKLQEQSFWNAWYDHSQYPKIFQKVFPSATVHPYKDRLDQMREFVDAQLANNPKREFTKDQLLQHKAELNRIRFDEPSQYLEKMNTLLKLIGYEVRRVCKDKNKPGYNRWRYYRIESQQLAS